MTDNKTLPDQLFYAVLGKLYDVLTMGDETVPRSANDFFSWVTPGIPYPEDQFDFLMQGFTAMVRKPSQQTQATDGISLKEKMGAQTAELYQEAENLARLVDFIPSVDGISNDDRRQNIMTNVWNPGATVSGMYEYVLRMSQVVKTELDEKTKAKIERFRNLLVTKKKKLDLITDEELEVSEPSEIVKRYYEKMTAYEDAALEYSNYKTSALTASSPEAVHFWANNARTLRRRVEAAYNDWIANGYKNDYEAIAAYISHVMSRDLTLLKQEYQEDLRNALLTGISSGSDFHYTSLLPGNFARARGWTKFSFTQNDFESHYKYDRKKWGGKTRYLGGFFSIGGGAQGAKTAITSDVDWSTFSLDFEMAQVPIVRPWFHPEFLTSKYWRFHPDAKKTGQTDLLSDGKLPVKGGMPAFPTAIIFVRNLKMNFKTFSRNYDAISKALSASGGLRIGPFSAGGKYKSNSYERDVKSNLTKEGIEIPGMQIAGFRCHLLPASPNPISGIKEEDWV